VKIGKATTKEIDHILTKNRDVMLESNVLGSDFSFLKIRTSDLVFKMEPMVFYKFLTAQENAALSVTFPINDFIASGTWPSIAMTDFEKPKGVGKEFFDYVTQVLRNLGERKIRIASGHTGFYGNVGHGVVGSMALIGLEGPIFSFARIEKDDSFYSVGYLGTELSYFRGKQERKSNTKPSDLSIEKYVKEFLKMRRTVHYVHDMSEGGLIRAIGEVSELIKSGFNVGSEHLKSISARGAEDYGVNVLSASSSGSVIVSVERGRKEEFEGKMKENAFPFIEIEKRKKGVTVDGKKFSPRDSVVNFLK
jgi:hydrogenase maturation factor